MKISEFARIDEGIAGNAWNLAKRYFGDTDSKIKAWAEYQGRQRQAASQGVQAAKRKEFIQHFINSFNLGKSSGKIASTVATPESIKSYRSFSKILESKMQLNEAINVHDFVVQYVKTYTSSHGDITDSPGFDDDIKAISRDIETNGANDKNVGKLFDYITSSLATTKPNASSKITTAYPPADDILQIKNNTFNFTLSGKKWTVTGGGEITDPDQINSLNNAYWQQARNSGLNQNNPSNTGAGAAPAPGAGTGAGTGAAPAPAPGAGTGAAPAPGAGTGAAPAPASGASTARVPVGRKIAGQLAARRPLGAVREDKI